VSFQDLGEVFGETALASVSVRLMDINDVICTAVPATTDISYLLGFHPGSCAKVENWLI
jgi:hypothetical protein